MSTHLARALPWMLFLFVACQKPGSKPDGGEPSLQVEGWDSALKMAEIEDLNPDPDVVEVNLEAKVQNVEVRAGQPVALFTYNGTLPGPIIRGKRGDRLVVHFTNNLPEPTTIHWHGVRVPNAMDGAETVQKAVPPGGTFDYTFDLVDSGTYWYHPHVRSSAQVGFGLYGSLIVAEPDEPRLGDELVMMLSDIGIKDDGTLIPADDNGWFGDYFGREGDLLLVNGKLMPNLVGRIGAPQRWRIINAARSHYYKLKAPPGTKLYRIGGDGGLGTKPLSLTEVVIIPGERAELYVLPTEAPAEGRATLNAEDADRFKIGYFTAGKPLMTYEVSDAAPAEAPALPTTLRDIEPLDQTGAKARSVSLDEVNVGGTTHLGVNGKTGPNHEMLHATVGDTEVWEVSNNTQHDHPFHLHGFFFQVLESNGKAWPMREWKDSVNVPAKQKVKLVLKYDNRPGMWMFHCHILDHAELGMMAMLMVM